MLEALFLKSYKNFQCILNTEPSILITKNLTEYENKRVFYELFF